MSTNQSIHQAIIQQLSLKKHDDPRPKMIFDIKMNVLDMDAGMAAIFGLEKKLKSNPEDIIHHSWYEIIEEMEQRRPFYQQLLSGKIGDYVTKKMIPVKFKQSTRYFDVSYELIRKNNHIIGMIAWGKEVKAEKW